MTGVQPKTRELLATDVRATPAKNSSWYDEMTDDAQRDEPIQSRRSRRAAIVRSPWR